MTASTQITFDIRQWAAWAPGVHTHDEWLAWAYNPTPSLSDDAPAVPDIAPMVRRRMNRLSRMVHTVTSQIPYAAQLPQVYCSRHGDMVKSYSLLKDLAHQEPLSSTTFGLSVHNAVAASASIIQHNTQPITTIAAGRNSFAQAIIEAVAQLSEHPEVLVVAYDETKPDFYQSFIPKQSVYAFALLITAGTRHQLSWSPSDAAETQQSIPYELLAFAHLLRSESSLSYHLDGCHWQWQHA